MDLEILTRIFKNPTITRLLILLSVIGLGIITASVDNDAGGIATYSLACSQFGYSFLWLLIPTTIVLAMLQEIGVRMEIVSKKGLEDLICERIDVRLTFIIMSVV